MEKPENKPYIELHGAQFESYESHMSPVEVGLSENGYPAAFPELGEDEFLMAELIDSWNKRRLFIVYRLGDMKALHESYVDRPPEDRKGKLSWFKCIKTREK